MTSIPPDPIPVAVILAVALPCATLTELPRDLGVLLLAVGVVGVVAPGIPGTPALVAACVILDPQGFGWLEVYFAQRFPRMHRASLAQLTRFIQDMERRYPVCSRLG